MADRKVNSETNDFPIPRKDADPKSHEIIIKLPQRGKYDVYQKDYPDNLPTGYTWINNFGLKERKPDPRNPNRTLDTTSSDPYTIKVDTYSIELDDNPGKEPVYFDGTAVKQFLNRKESLGNNRIRLSLDLGDPPIGWP